MTKSIEAALRITRDRRLIQDAYNKAHGITPKTVIRSIVEDLAKTFGEVVETLKEEGDTPPSHLTSEDIDSKISFYSSEMKLAAKELRFEDAAHFRDLLRHYQELRMME